MENIFDDLNESQRDAVLYNEGPLLIIAGAGSGKTRVLTYKIAYLLQQGIPPYGILALTFTNKAAREMKERIAKVVGSDVARQIWMGTFHSIFSKILRKNASLLGFKSDFTIYDSSDSKNLIKTIIKEMQLDDKIYRPNAIQSQISNAKNHLITPGMYSSNSELLKYDSQANRPLVHEIYQRYWNRCKQAGAMDFDDLLLYTNILFRDFPEVLAQYQHFFKYILVDEYQDTNKAQHLIVELLAKQHHHVCVVGDDAQSIYSFRGANIANILNFKSTIPDTKIFKLEQNYRSTQTIVNAANSLIKKNKEQIAKTIFSTNDEGAKIPLYKSISDFEEAYLVANKIEEMRIRCSYKYNDFAILYRTNAQSRVLEEAFRKRSIPYRIYGGLSFYQRKEIKDIISYFRLTINPNDEEALKRIINYPTRGIGDTTLGKIAQAATIQGVSFFEVLKDPIGFGLKVNNGTMSKLGAFRDMILSFQNDNKTMNAYDLAFNIIRQSGISQEMKDINTVEGISRKENVDELLNGIRDFVNDRLEQGINENSISEYLSEISLATDQDNDKSVDSDMVTMMTVHASKGLEFKNVFIVGMEEDLFPSQMAKETFGGLEEERRLFYVAITRAQEHCALSYAGMRFKNGQQQPGSPSRFIKDIDDSFLILPKEDRLSQTSSERAQNFAHNSVSSNWSDYNGRKTKDYNSEKTSRDSHNSSAIIPSKRLSRISPNSASSNTPSDSSKQNTNASVSKGNIIRHDRFGLGTVVNVEGSGDNLKATVDFDNVGVKQLLLKYAKFDILQ